MTSRFAGTVVWWLGCPVLLLALGGAAPAFSAAGEDPEKGAIPGFSHRASHEQRRLERRMAPLLDPASTARHFRYLTEEPHPAGSERNYELAEYVRDRFVEYGLQDVEMLRYDVLLPFPR